jgi:hypothetical protein
MTRTELLAATGNIWYVACYRDGNRKRFQAAIYVRAASAKRTRAVGKKETIPPTIAFGTQTTSAKNFLAFRP